MNKMAKEYIPNPDWSQRDLKAIEMNDLFYSIVKGFNENKVLGMDCDLLKYQNMVREDVTMLGEYPILLNNNNKLMALINNKSRELLNKN